MKKHNLIGWILIMALLLVWTNQKSKEAREAQQRKREIEKIDSLARLDQRTDQKESQGITRGKDQIKDSLRPMQNQKMEQGAGRQELQAVEGDSVGTETSTPEIPHKVFTVETKDFTVELDNLGARVTSVKLKDLNGKTLQNHELIPQDRGGALTLSLAETNLSNEMWRTETKAGQYKLGSDSMVIRFSQPVSGENLVATRTYTFYPDSNLFRHDLEVPEFSGNYGVSWPAGLNETETILEGKGFGLLSSFFSEIVLDNGVTVQREAFEGKKTFNEESGVLRWVGLRRKYVAAILNFNRETTHKVEATAVQDESRSAEYPKSYKLDIKGSAYEDNALDFDFVIVPLNYTQLVNHHQNYEKIIFSGWEWFFRADVWYVALCGFVLKLLNFFHGLIPNYGVAIILLTLLVRTVTLPLTISQTKSAAKMAEHAPEIKKIRDKYKSQPQRLNLEIMAYYKKAGVNPFAGMLGCFPLLLQMPIFIALFNVLGRAVELKDAGFFAWIGDLSYPDVILPALKIPYIFPLGLTVLPFFMAGTMYVQMKMTIKDPNQKFMVWMMPIMMFVFSCSFPSGLVLYWTVSNIFTIGQTYFFMHKPKAATAISTIPVKTKK